MKIYLSADNFIFCHSCAWHRWGIKNTFNRKINSWLTGELYLDFFYTVDGEGDEVGEIRPTGAIWVVLISVPISPGNCRLMPGLSHPYGYPIALGSMFLIAGGDGLSRHFVLGFKCRINREFGISRGWCPVFTKKFLYRQRSTHEV